MVCIFKRGLGEPYKVGPYLKCAELLLEAGAHADYAYEIKLGEVMNVMDLAIATFNHKMMRLLLKYDARITNRQVWRMFYGYQHYKFWNNLVKDDIKETFTIMKKTLKTDDHLLMMDNKMSVLYRAIRSSTYVRSHKKMFNELVKHILKYTKRKLIFLKDLGDRDALELAIECADHKAFKEISKLYNRGPDKKRIVNILRVHFGAYCKGMDCSYTSTPWIAYIFMMLHEKWKDLKFDEVISKGVRELIKYIKEYEIDEEKDDEDFWMKLKKDVVKLEKLYPAEKKKVVKKQKIMKNNS